MWKFKQQVKKNDNVEVSEEDVKQAQKEARALAQKIINKIVEKHCDDGWENGDIWDLNKGKCGNWLKLLEQVVEQVKDELDSNLTWFNSAEKTDAKGVDHTAILICPTGGSTDADTGLIIDPWRKEGEPWWIDGAKDTDMNWDD